MSDVTTHSLICAPAGDERIPFLNIAWGENPVVLLCDDLLKAAACKETFLPRIWLAAAVTFFANVVHLHTARNLSIVFIRGPRKYTYWVTYCWTLNELFRAPLLGYRSASFPISIASSAIFASRKAVEVNALAIALASKKASVRLFSPKLTPHVICVP